MSKHTQIFKTTVVGVGPWCVEFPDGEIVTTRFEDRARLIAAAPDLLQALIDLGDWLAYGLNKADGAEPTVEDHAACERVAAQARAAIDKATAG